MLSEYSTFPPPASRLNSLSTKLCLPCPVCPPLSFLAASLLVTLWLLPPALSWLTRPFYVSRRDWVLLTVALGSSWATFVSTIEFSSTPPWVLL